MLHSCDNPIILGIISALFLGSELLGRSKCKSNSFCCLCLKLLKVVVTHFDQRKSVVDEAEV